VSAPWADLRLDRWPSWAPPRHPAVIADVTLWTGSTWREHADVVLLDGAVAQIVDHEPGRRADGAVLDGSGAHLIPGFTNTHTHLQQAVCRGVGEGEPLLAWLLAIGEGMVGVTPERAYVAAVAAALEGLLSGATTVVEHAWPHPDRRVWHAVQAALDDVGVHAVLGVGVADRPDPTRRWGFEPRLMKPLGEVLDDVEDLLAVTKGSRVRPGLAAANPRSLTVDGMRSVRRFAESRDLTVMIHLAETGTDDAACRENVGVDAVTHLASGDFLWERLLAVHGVALGPAASAELARHQVALSWNPVSNMRLGSGVAPVLDWREMGLDVGIGVDGAGSNDRQDMWETLRSGAYVQRAVHQRADLLGFAEMMAMAVDGAGRSLGAEPPPGQEPGGVVVGRRADLTLVRFERDFACLPVRDPGASLLTTATPRIVDIVLVEGEVVVADGRSTRVDEAALVSALSGLPA